MKSPSAKENSFALFAKISIGLNIKTIKEAANEINVEMSNFSFMLYFSILRADLPSLFFFI